MVKMGCGCDPDKAEDIINFMMKEIKDIKDNGPSEEELDSVKKILLKDYDEKLERNSFWLGELQGSSLLNYDLEKSLKNREIISKITSQQFREGALKYLDEKNNVIIIALPEKNTSGEGDKKKE